jgi:putative tricarboxylic transport membrane protein
MSDNVHEAGGAGPSHRTVEIGVAGVLALLAIIGMYGSVKVGIGWGVEGPRAGFFPFYVSAIVLISCAVNIGNALRSPDDGKIFAEWQALGKVVSVVIPTAIYAVLVAYIGLYVSSALLIAVFMRWFGKYGWLTTAAVAIVVPVLIFFMFEIWFLVPLPKGPLETYLGY